MKKFILATASALAAAAACHPARAATNWSFFELQCDSQYATASPPTDFTAFPIFFPASGNPLSGTYRTPNGTGTGTYSPTGGTGGGEAYTSVAAVQAEGLPLLFTATANSVTSTYNFNPDYGSLTQSSIPTLTMTSFATGSTINAHQPVFSWTDTGSFSSLSVQVANAALGINDSYTLPLNQTSWSAPFSLANGSWIFNLRSNTTMVQLPLNATLTGGPDVGLPSTIGFQDFAIQHLTFTVVPEPAAAVALLLPLARLGRRRQPARPNPASR